MKNKLISIITDKIKPTGVKLNLEGDSDIVISEELFKIGFFGGKRKITYDANILINVSDSVIYMWEKVVDSKSGITAGFSGGSYIQSGSTVYRKVKLIQVALDGRIF